MVFGHIGIFISYPHWVCKLVYFTLPCRHDGLQVPTLLLHPDNSGSTTQDPQVAMQEVQLDLGLTSTPMGTGCYSDQVERQWKSRLQGCPKCTEMLKSGVSPVVHLRLRVAMDAMKVEGSRLLMLDKMVVSPAYMKH